MKVKIYVEGGGEGRVLKTECKKGFSQLLQKCLINRKMPEIHPGGSRNNTYELFKTSLLVNEPHTCSILLVDSEDPVSTTDFWTHLQIRDGWERPNGASDEQVHLMITCMESWIMADHDGIISFFGSRTRRNALLPLHNLEQRHRHDVQDSLEAATEDCGRERAYKKGKRSFQVLATLDSTKLNQNLSSFRHFIEYLNQVLEYR